jgi:hypothetical protein
MDGGLFCGALAPPPNCFTSPVSTVSTHATGHYRPSPSPSPPPPKALPPKSQAGDLSSLCRLSRTHPIGRAGVGPVPGGDQGLLGESSAAQHAPGARHAVHRDGIQGVVHLRTEQRQDHRQLVMDANVGTAQQGTARRSRARRSMADISGALDRHTRSMAEAARAGAQRVLAPTAQASLHCHLLGITRALS